MQPSNILISKIKEFEGCRLHAYRDSVGVPTIGYGSTKNVRMGMVITEQTAEARLIDDIHNCIVGIERLNIPFKSQGQIDAIIDFVFNLGIGRLKSSTLLKKILANAPTAEIQEQFNRWVYAGSTKLPGLVKRRAWEAQRWADKS